MLPADVQGRASRADRFVSGDRAIFPSPPPEPAPAAPVDPAIGLGSSTLRETVSSVIYLPHRSVMLARVSSTALLGGDMAWSGRAQSSPATHAARRPSAALVKSRIREIR